VIVDTHNVESQLAWRIARRTRCPLSAAGFALLAVNTARTERRCLPSADVVWAVSDADAAWYRRHLPLRRVEVVPNVLDLSRYSRATGPTDAGPPVVLYVGWYAHRPNREAADRLIAASRLLIARGVAHRLRLVGRDPTRAMRRAAGRDEHIEVTGAVAEIPPELTGATVFAAPLTSGGGTKFKILEAFAASLPVLTTPVGAEGLHLRRGEQAEIVAPAAGPFADALAALLADPPRRTGLARAGRSHVERHFSQQSLTATIAALLGT
jgi:glycosyltransferase involved in cell wall biosynthesis